MSAPARDTAAAVEKAQPVTTVRQRHDATFHDTYRQPLPQQRNQRAVLSSAPTPAKGVDAIGYVAIAELAGGKNSGSRRRSPSYRRTDRHRNMLHVFEKAFILSPNKSGALNTCSTVEAQCGRSCNDRWDINSVTVKIREEEWPAAITENKEYAATDATDIEKRSCRIRIRNH